MSETMIVDGAEFEVSRRGTWIAVLGAEHVVHLRHNGIAWHAWRPTMTAIEPIGTAKTLEDCARLAIRHYKALCAESKKRVAGRLAAFNLEKQP